MTSILGLLPRRSVIGTLDGLRHRRLRDASVVLAGLILLVQVGTPAPAAAAVTSDPRIIQDEPTLSDVERAQVPLVEVADKLQEALTGSGPSGFAGVAVDVEQQTVRLYWKDDLTAAAADLISTLTPRVAVEVVAVPYSQEELLEESRRIAQKNPSAVTEVGPTSDFKGLRVAINGSFNTSQVRATIAGGSTVPLSFTVGRPAEFAVDRWDDIDPYWGGNAITSGGFCTTAFAARTNATGADALITARHCGMNTDWFTPIGNRLVGRTALGNAGLDAIVLLGSRYSSIIYVGGPRSNVGRSVVGAGNPALNSFVFASGSWSGAHVLQVALVNQFINIGGQTIGPGFWTEDLEGDGSVGNGDSGGPVAQAAADLTTVNARGMIDAIDLNFEEECEGLVADQRRCASRAFHVNIGQIATGLGITIKTV